jgi:hypothetical protein
MICLASKIPKRLPIVNAWLTFLALALVKDCEQVRDVLCGLQSAWRALDRNMVNWEECSDPRFKEKSFNILNESMSKSIFPHN